MCSIYDRTQPQFSPYSRRWRGGGGGARVSWLHDDEGQADCFWEDTQGPAQGAIGLSMNAAHWQLTSPPRFPRYRGTGVEEG